MVVAVIAMIIGFIATVGFFFVVDVYPEFKAVGIILLVSGLYFLIVEGIVKFITMSINGSTYVEVYEDRFAGTGVSGFKALNFDIKFDKVSNLSVERKFWLHIHTSGGTYKIMANEKTAAQVFEYFNQTKN